MVPAPPQAPPPPRAAVPGFYGAASRKRKWEFAATQGFVAPIGWPEGDDGAVADGAAVAEYATPALPLTSKAAPPAVAGDRQAIDTLACKIRPGQTCEDVEACFADMPGFVAVQEASSDL